jgi:hypothetical protein
LNSWNSLSFGSTLACATIVTPLKPPGMDAPLSVPTQRSGAVIDAFGSMVRIARIALAQKVGSPMT